MPELPEVETIRRQLQKLIVGKKIREVKVNLPKMVKLPSWKFRKTIIGATVKEVRRRAKILIIELSNDWNLLIHLKLSGRLIFRKKGELLGPEDIKWNHSKNIRSSPPFAALEHLIYYFSDGSRLFHNDLRQFGYVKLVKSGELSDFFKKEKLGTEPLEKNFSFDKFLAILKKKPKAKIKQFLLDQKNIAGIGNIYSDEILFFARVHPLRKVQELKYSENKKVFEGIRKILVQAIRFGGSSVRDFLDALGKEGEYVPKLKVYGREGEKCSCCGAIIKRIKIGSRSAHFCPRCQKLC
jgi:formamidopyrimidine-DNA glycosylase